MFVHGRQMVVHGWMSVVGPAARNTSKPRLPVVYGLTDRNITVQHRLRSYLPPLPTIITVPYTVGTRT